MTLIGTIVQEWASQVAQVVKNLPTNAGDLGDAGLISGAGRSPGGGNGNPLQYSCLGNPMDRAAWWASVHGITESDTTDHAHTLCNVVAQGGNGDGDLMQEEPGYLCKAGQTQYTNQWIWGAWEGIKVDVMVFDLNNLKDEIAIYWDREGSRRSGLKKSYAMLSHKDNLLYSLLKYLVLVFTPKSLIHVELISVFSVKQGFIVNFSLVWKSNFLSTFYWIISSLAPSDLQWYNWSPSSFLMCMDQFPGSLFCPLVEYYTFNYQGIISGLISGWAVFTPYSFTTTSRNS